MEAAEKVNGHCANNEPPTTLPDTNGRALNPEEMVQNTKNLLESLLETSPINRRKVKPENCDSSDSGNTKLNKRKKRRVGNNLDSDSDSSEEFVTSPLRKSLSPKFLKSPKPRHKYRTRTTRKRISYEDVPDMSASDTDFASPRQRGTSSSEDTPSTSGSSDTGSTGTTHDTTPESPVTPGRVDRRTSSDSDEKTTRSTRSSNRNKRKKRKVKTRMPIFKSPTAGRSKRNIFAKNEGTYYRDKLDEIDECEMLDTFVESETSSSEGTTPPSKRKVNVIEDSVESSSDSTETQSPNSSGHVSPQHVTPRRSERCAPSRHDASFSKSLNTLREAKQHGVKAARRLLHSGDEEEDTSDHSLPAVVDELSDTRLSDEHHSDIPADQSTTYHFPDYLPCSGTQDFRAFAARNRYRSRRGRRTRAVRPRAVSSTCSSINKPLCSSINKPLYTYTKPSEPACAEPSQLQPNILNILRSGAVNKLPADLTPETHPTLLLEACTVSSADMVEYIVLKHGYDVFAKGAGGMPLTYAITHDKPRTVTVLLSAMSHQPHKILSELIKRCLDTLVDGDLDCLRSIVQWSESNTDISQMPILEQVVAEDRGGVELLSAIGAKMQVGALELLLQHDVDLRESEQGHLLLHQCVEHWQSQPDKATAFLDYLAPHVCASWLEVRYEEFTVLMRAAAQGAHPAVQKLLALGAEADVCDSEGTTALHLAAIGGHAECVKALMVAPQSLSCADRSGWTAVMYAVYVEKWDTVDLLLAPTLDNNSTALLTSIYELMSRRYTGSEEELREKNYHMVMELLKYVAHNDNYRVQLNHFVDTCSDQILDNSVFHELFTMPGLIITRVKWRWVRRHLGECRSHNVRIDRRRYMSSLCDSIPSYPAHLKATFSQEQATGPGPTKEFFSMFGEEAVKEKLFIVSSEGGSLLFSHLLTLSKQDLDRYQQYYYYYMICGSMVALSLVQGYCLQFKPHNYILNYMLHGQKQVLRDLEHADKQLYTSVNSISEQDFADLEIPFSIDIQHPLTGTVVEVPLKKGGVAGDEQCATSKQGYLTLLARSKLYDLCEHELRAMRAGFNVFFPLKYCHMFTPVELSTLLTGDTELDVEDWQRHCKYAGLTQEMKEYFWGSVSSFSTEDRLLLLHFTTALSALPPGGFANIPGHPFTVSSIPGGEPDTLLPTASVCFNVINLPPYSSLQSMKKHILIAVRFGAQGFTFG